MDTFGILKLKTAKMRLHGRLTENAIGRLPELANLIEGYTEEQITELTYRASACCLVRYITRSSIATLDEKTIKVDWQDFESALQGFNEN